MWLFSGKGWGQFRRQGWTPAFAGEQQGSGILLAGMMKRQHLNGVSLYAIDEDVVWRDQGFPRAGDAAGPIHIGMVGQVIGGVADRSAYAFGGGRVVRFYGGDDAFEFSQRAGSPDDRQH